MSSCNSSSSLSNQQSNSTTEQEIFKNYMKLEQWTKKIINEIVITPQTTITTKKNRYSNVLPNYSTRVSLLNNINKENDDMNYINANFVGSKQQFIATQAPLPNTIHDFWDMVWKQNIGLIVMLTNLKEEKLVPNSQLLQVIEKANCYWPTNADEIIEGETWKIIQFLPTVEFRESQKVKNNENNNNNNGKKKKKLKPEYVIRQFRMTQKNKKKYDEKENECESENIINKDRIITMLHYRAWPDHGVPSDYNSFNNFYNHYCHLKAKINQFPILVHCSAGIGRTGVFCAISNIMDDNAPYHFSSAQLLSIVKKQIQELRLQRFGCVQGLDQFYFIIRFIEHLLHYRRLKATDSFSSSLSYSSSSF